VTPPSLRELAWVVCRDVNRTLGGIAAMELLRRQLTAKGWMAGDGHALLVAVSRLTPGTNVLAYCVGLGWLLRGSSGAVVSLAAASVPASLLIVALSATIVRIDQHPIVRVLIAVGVLVATALVLSTAWHLLRPYTTRSTVVRTAVIAAVVVGLLAAGVTPVRILLAAALVGMVMGAPAPVGASEADR
jgi:chromate transporter